MSTPIKSVQFVSPISFGGQKKSLGRNAAGDRPGQMGADIEVDDKHRFITCSRTVANIYEETIVPMTNVASFVPLSDKEMAAVMKQKEEEARKRAPAPQVKK